ncbi:Uncharacterized protein Adt_42650 [Abeliophyllum distichum]|uniref:Uncharacterized protein n=1 Tax=Abeliophyllum distichum TaxID=126358 RepID=A0ABD1PT51_9LAMI
MSSSSSLLFFLTIWLFISIAYPAKAEVGNYGDGTDGTISSPSGCNNCTICQYPCHPQPPPSGYQSYGTPPPPQVVQGNCPPAAPAQCCQHAPPMPFYSPYNNYSGSDSLQLPMIKLFIFKGSSAVFFSLILLFVSLV